MPSGKLRVLLIMFVAVAAVSLGEALLSRGMKQSNAAEGSFWSQVRGVIGNRYVIMGTVLLVTYFLLTSLALRWADLSFVLPLTAFSFVIDAILARYYLAENVTPVRWLGAAIIAFGVGLVGLGDSGESTTP
jgi:drug/metabolite transporter (DMT)-like permease